MHAAYALFAWLIFTDFPRIYGENDMF